MNERLRVDAAAAVRALRATPGPIVWAVVMLAVAVGLNLAMFGLVDRALLSPPAHVTVPERVFSVGFASVGDDAARGRMTTTSWVTFEAIRAHTSSASNAAAWERISTAAVVDSMQVAADAMMVSGEYFELLGARPLLGRTILADDDVVAAASPPVVLSYPFWRTRFGGDPAVVGRRIAVRGVEFTVAGVMPAGFSGHSAARVDLWIPFAAAMQQTPGWEGNQFRNFASILLRLKPGESAASAASQATAALQSASRRVTLSPIGGAGIGSNEQRIAYWLTAVSGLVLVIGLANTATLLLVRGARRRRDLAIQTALGATRGRLLSQVIVEAAALAAAGVGAALLLALWFDESVRRVLMPSVIESAGLSSRVLGAASLAGLLAFLVGTAAGAVQLPGHFRSSDLGGATRGRPRRRAHMAMLVVQTTLSVVLLAGAGVFGRSLFNLVSQDFGMRMEDVLLVEFERGPGVDDETELFVAALERIRALPGVERATTINGLPFAGHVIPPIGVPGRAESPNVDGQLPFLIPTTSDLFEILDIRITQGRGITAGDERGPMVVVVNETMARTVWPGESALGKCIRIGFDPSFDPFTADGPPGPPTTVPCREVVGVAHDVRQRSVLPDGREERLMQYFVPFSQVPPPPAGVGSNAINVRGLLVRARGDANALVDPIRHLVTSGRTDLPFLRVRAYSELLDRQMRPWRQGTILLSLFGAMALGVAAMGLYATFAHVVHERRRELAIRIAIGAKPAGVLLMILREAGVLAGAGIVCGSLITLAGGRWVESLLFGTAPWDPLVLAASAATMLGVAALATLVPARTAARTDPNSLLRAE